MAFPLSSAIISYKHSLNVSITPSFPKPSFLPTRFVFCSNQMPSKDPARPARPRIHCLSKKTRSEELADWHDFPTNFYLSICRHGIKKLENTKVPRTGELALRKAIPANTSMKTIQESLEDISYLLRIPQRKPFGTMEGNVKKALKIAVDEKDSILASLPTNLKEKGSTLYASLIDGKGGLQALLESIKDKDPDKVSVGLASSLDTVAEIELLQAPGLSFLLPKQYLNYPRLTGRGIVEFTIEKGDGSTFSPEAGGELRKTATIQVAVDGYSAPLTAGNFAKLVIDGAYDGAKLNCTDQAVLSDSGLDKNGYNVPLEIMPSGQFEPLYRTTLNVQDGELPILPLSVYGAVAMAHSEVSEEYSSPYQFFFYLYDKRNAGLGGLSFDEGQFSVFGYTIVGKDILPQIKTGDVIRSAKLVEGQDRLILPNES
ncbi:peptidyl-prolyl cis-trans isomerase CYP37, chloroplastic isoform X2 [Quercus lobata]|uniref:peptidyl-prolyl cis-trans isomerase CYP37, chloroplastic isoform X2 n=1 Tax=Quercus lobata TaxID=97700 RepID=UPI001246DE93|nr:peptidyl-prolyl cis-trans isomerase CYP37, chloroplastic isoform X2 [Quercus lobata]